MDEQQTPRRTREKTQQYKHTAHMKNVHWPVYLKSALFFFHTCVLFIGMLCMRKCCLCTCAFTNVYVFHWLRESKSHLFALFTEAPAALSCSYSNKTKALFAGQQSRNTGLILVYLYQLIKYTSIYKCRLLRWNLFCRTKGCAPHLLRFM